MEIELEEIIENIKFKLPKDLNIPIIINHEDNLKNYITKIINQHGEIFLILNSLQSADKLFMKMKEQRLKRRQKLAQSTIGKFSTIKASTVALNPFIFFDIAGSFAIDTALIRELSKIYGLNLKGESTRKIFKNISINNLFLGVTQVGVHTSFNFIRKLILLTAPFTNGLSLLPYGPIAIIQAAISIQSTKILGKLSAKEIFQRSKASFVEPYIMIKNINFNEPEIFKHINIYLSKRNLKNNFISFLP
jgi:GTP-binding protein Era